MGRMWLVGTFFAAGCVPVLVSGDTDVDTGREWVAPDNDWPTGTPPGDLVASGFDVGEVVPDFRLIDQFGKEVSLWQFYGRPVVIDISAMWCIPCRELAEHAQETAELFEASGLVYVTVLPENVERHDPTGEDLTAWADFYGIAHPVVADPGRLWSVDAVPPPTDAFPRLLVVGPDMVVADDINPPADADLRLALAELTGGE